MVKRLTIALVVAALAAPQALKAQTPDSSVSAGRLSSGSSITNPAISVIGWFQAVGGNDSTAQENPFELREAELSFQAAVDPFTRADFFLSASSEGLEVEEGTITWLALPGGGQLKLGKFRADLGKFNRTHPPETPFADRPLSTAAFTGPEGLSTSGVSASVLLPNPFDLYWDLIANAGTVPGAGESPVFEATSRSDVLVLGRTSVFVPVRESADLNLGLSYANAAAQPALQSQGSRAMLGVADVTLRWKNPRRSIYRSLIALAEITGERGSSSGAQRLLGGFGYVLYQCARQWKLGARYDWTERPDAPEHASGALALIQYQPSEFSTLSLQGRRVHDALTDRDFDSAFFKWTFNIGPHGAHPY